MRGTARGIAILLGLVVVGSGCSQTDPVGSVDATTIRDRSGRLWDVTHAVVEYGFESDQFQFGLGTGVIPPVFDPVLVGPGESGYPAPDDDRSVIGVVWNGEPRAYSIRTLSRHEVVNEVFGDTPVAVAY